MIKNAIDFYKINGYTIIRGFLSSLQCDKAINQINRLIQNFEITSQQVTVFDTQNRKHDLNDYFKNSADKISFFFQKKAFENGKLIKPKLHSINKIGHALHQKNQLFKQITYKKINKQICQQLKISKPVVVQSMAILKPPEIGGEVPDHQDSTFLYDTPQTLVGFWIPLQDATVKNGCLWGIPASHKGKLYKRHKHVNDQVITEKIHQIDFKRQDFVPMEMKRGDLALFSGRFIHRSNQNLSLISRYAYTWHLKQQSTEWSKENWLQRKQFPRVQFQHNQSI